MTIIPQALLVPERGSHLREQRQAQSGGLGKGMVPDAGNRRNDTRPSRAPVRLM